MEEQSQFVAAMEDGEVDHNCATEEGDWDIEGLVTIDEMERMGVRGKLCHVQDACRARTMSGPTTVLEVIDLVAHVVSVRKQKAPLERRNARVLCVLKS